MKFSDVLFHVIDLAKKANAARAQRAHLTVGVPAVTTAAQSRSTPPVAPLGTPITLTALPEERALQQFLESQSPETVYMLAAIMYLGRGDFDADGLLDNFAIMEDRFGDMTRAAWQMADKLALPDYLKAGMEKAASFDFDAIVSTDAGRANSPSI